MRNEWQNMEIWKVKEKVVCELSRTCRGKNVGYVGIATDHHTLSLSLSLSLSLTHTHTSSLSLTHKYTLQSQVMTRSAMQYHSPYLHSVIFPHLWRRQVSLSLSPSLKVFGVKSSRKDLLSLTCPSSLLFPLLNSHIFCLVLCIFWLVFCKLDKNMPWQNFEHTNCSIMIDLTQPNQTWPNQTYPLRAIVRFHSDHRDVFASKSLMCKHYICNLLSKYWKKLNMNLRPNYLPILKMFKWVYNQFKLAQFQCETQNSKIYISLN